MFTKSTSLTKSLSRHQPIVYVIHLGVHGIDADKSTANTYGCMGYLGLLVQFQLC